MTVAVRAASDVSEGTANTADMADMADMADTADTADLVARRAPAAGTGYLRTRALCTSRGLDATSVPTIHITGTRGKTSTAWMVDALLREVGLATMRFTSPHLHCPGERIVVDGLASSPEELVHEWRRMRPTVESMDRAGQPVGFFDLVTTMFVERACRVRPDVAIVEVGRGGRHDATNVFAADVAVFTPIGGDHADLGATPVALARTKFGIATHGGRRPGGPRLVTGSQVPAVARFLTAAAAAGGWPLHRVEDRPPAAVDGVIRLPGRAALTGVSEVALAGHGPHHARNALVALAAVEAFLGGPLDWATVHRGLADVAVPGRLERRVVRGVTVRFDGAHDPLSAAAVRDALPAGRRVLVLGVAAGKDLDGILAALAGACDEVVATTVPSPGSATAARVAAAATRAGLAVRCVPDPHRALAVACTRAGRAGEVLVTGSLHLVGHLRRSPVDVAASA